MVHHSCQVESPQADIVRHYLNKMLKKTVLYIGHCTTLTLLQNWTGLPLQIILFHFPPALPPVNKERRKTGNW